MERTLKLKKFLNILIIILGNIGLAIGVELFIVPNNIITGGVAGIGLFVQNFFPEMRLSLFTFIFNAVMLLSGLIFLGKTFALTTLLSSICYPAAMAVLEFFFSGVKLTDNDLLAALYAGLLVGVSMGFVIKEGASTGGVDIPVMIIHKYTNIPVSVLVYATDFIIIILQCTQNPFDRILYGIAMLFISSASIDKVMIFGNKKVQMKIVSEKYEEIRQAIIKETDRGVTVLYGETGYLRAPVHMVLSVMSSREVFKIRKTINEIDETAFITISEVSEVRGRGFTLDKDYYKPDENEKQ